jgi:methylated-DNA-[protein]-cysteine S-methyltransferase
MDLDTRHAFVTTALGELTLVATGGALVGVYFPRHWPKPPEQSFGELVPATANSLLAAAERQLAEYFDGARSSFDLPTATRSDRFQERVWSLLQEIPYGETTTYGDLAEKVGGRHLARDVGQAVGRNPLSVIIPCHRVVGKDGKLTGYAGGLKRKQVLLELEGRHGQGQGRRPELEQLVLHGLSSPAASGR